MSYICIGLTGVAISKVWALCKVYYILLHSNPLERVQVPDILLTGSSGFATSLKPFFLAMLWLPTLTKTASPSDLYIRFAPENLRNVLWAPLVWALASLKGSELWASHFEGGMKRGYNGL